MLISIAPSIETQSNSFEREITFFPIKKILTTFLERFIIRKTNEFLDEAYTDILGVLVVLKNYEQVDAKRDLPFVKKAINLLVTYKAHLEKADYLGSAEIKTKISLVISALYDAEIQLKKKAFSGQTRTLTQPEIINALAYASKEAIQSALSR